MYNNSGMKVEEMSCVALFETPAWDDTAAPFERTYPITGTSNTAGSFTLTATNNVGLTAVSSAFSLVKDSASPTVHIAAPPEGGLVMPVRWGGEDGTGTGISSYHVQYKQGGGSWTDWLASITLTEADFIASAGASYTFRVQAEDKVGNTSAWAESGTASVQTVTKYYLFGGKPAAMRRGAGTSGAITYLATDHLGSVSLATSGTGAVVSESRFLPYGEERWSSGGSVTDFNFTRQPHRGPRSERNHHPHLLRHFAPPGGGGAEPGRPGRRSQRSAGVQPGPPGREPSQPDGL